MATMKTLNGYGFDSAKLGGRAPEYYTNPRNLLDNSDFTNPVNQRGNGDVNTQGDYPIDRWMFDENGSGCSAGYDANYKYLYLVNNATDGSWGSLYHNVPAEKLNAGTYTLSFHEKLIGPISILVTADDTVTVLESAIYEPDENGLIIAQFTISSRPSNKLLIAVYASQGITVAFDWAALYEGSYTAETLPPYVPKGKHVEMLNCGVSLTPHNLLDNSDFRNPVNQRGITTTDSSFTGYVLDRWIAQNSGTLITIDSNGLNVAASSGAKHLFQRLNNVKNGKTYTFAAALSDGTIGVCAFTLSSTTSTWEWIKEVRVSSSFQISVAHSNWIPLFVAMSNLTDTSARIIWAALYEGTYTADTLPPYVPKGYTAEFAECRRYYKRFTAPYAGIAGTGYVTGSTKYIYINPPDNYPMRINKPSFAFKGAINVRGINGYIVEDYGDAVIRVYENATGCIPTLEITRGDSAAWNATNNTPVAVQFHANSVLELKADL